MALYLLYESSSGYALFEAHGLDEIGQSAQAVQDSVTDLTRFGKVVKLTAFKPFGSAADAIEQANAISESECVLSHGPPSEGWAFICLPPHCLSSFNYLCCLPALCLNAACFAVDSLADILTQELHNFLEFNLPKVKAGKKAKFSLGVAEPKLGSAILEALGVPCQSNDFMLEFFRGIRLHFSRFIKDLKVCPSHLSRSLSLFRSLRLAVLIFLCDARC